MAYFALSIASLIYKALPGLCWPRTLSLGSSISCTLLGTCGSCSVGGSNCCSISNPVGKFTLLGSNFPLKYILPFAGCGEGLGKGRLAILGLAGTGGNGRSS